MAELGDIKTRDVNAGVVPVTDVAGQNALRGALNLTDKVITEVAEADLRGDLQKDADDALALSDETQPLEFDKIEGDGAIVELTNELRRHQATAAQANNSNKRVKAQQDMQVSLQAKKNKYPWLRDELDAEARQFMGASPELTELGLSDAGARSCSGRAGTSSDILDRVFKRAYGTGAEDYGMDPTTHPIGSVQFSEMWSRKSQLLAARVALRDEEELLKLAGSGDARRGFAVLQKQLLGPEGEMQQVYDAIDGQLTPLRIAQQQAARDGSPQGANNLAQVTQAFDADTKPRLNDNINSADHRVRRRRPVG